MKTKKKDEVKKQTVLANEMSVAEDGWMENWLWHGINQFHKLDIMKMNWHDGIPSTSDAYEMHTWV